MIEQITVERSDELKAAAVVRLREGLASPLMEHVDATDKKIGGHRLRSYLQAIADAPHEHNLYEVLAAARFFRLLGKYDYKPGKVSRFVRFFEALPLPGDKGRQYYPCSPVQVFQWANIYGFYTEPGKRLTREVLLFVPRKYGKTTMCGAIALFDAICGDYDAEAYISANSFDQAQICYRGISKITKLLDSGSGDFRSTRDTIECRIPGRESSIRCLANSPERLDGLKASVSISDELSQADSFALKNVITTSMGTRANPLVVDITTASAKTESPFVDELGAYQRILREETEDDAVFAHLFMPDLGDDESDPTVWKKVNPHIGVTVKEDFYAAEYKKALRSYDNMVDFRTKLLNVFVYGDQQSWITADEIYPLMQDWKFIIPQPNEYADEGVCAFDLSIKDDFSAVSYMVYRAEVQKFFSKTVYYFPEGQLERHPNSALYAKWAEEGWLTLLPGNTINYARIADDIISMADHFVICRIGYDPYKDAELINILKAAGAERILKPVGQTRGNFTSATGQMEMMVDNDGIVFDMNPITPWCFGNAVIDEDNNGNRKPVKRAATSSGKIDGVITNCMCVKLFAEMK